jgi:predicted enzyme involved in methoxymalonyl-ACP biosynthesis
MELKDGFGIFGIIGVLTREKRNGSMVIQTLCQRVPDGVLEQQIINNK